MKHRLPAEVETIAEVFKAGAPSISFHSHSSKMILLSTGIFSGNNTRVCTERRANSG